MRIFQNIDSDAEIISDSYKFNYLFEDCVIEVQSRMIPKDGDVNVDIGCGNAFGGNAEEEIAGGAGV
jgi:hypothetical protein